MHAYGTDQGRVRIDNLIPAERVKELSTLRPVNIDISVQKAARLREQLGVAIHEAELRAIRQLSLVFPGEDAA